MSLKELVASWFKVWDKGNVEDLPISDDFKHTSPYGVIEGKENYMQLVYANMDKFLGKKFVLHDEIYEGNRGAVRYTLLAEDFSMEVSEWYLMENDELKEITAYYNIEGEISEDRKLKDL